MQIKAFLHDFAQANHQISKLDVELNNLLDSSLDFYHHVKACQYSNEPKAYQLTDLSDVLLKIEKQYTSILKDIEHKLEYYRKVKLVGREMLSKLTKEESNIIEERYLNEKSWKQIDLNTNSVCIKHFRILEKLRNISKENDHIKNKLEELTL